MANRSSGLIAPDSSYYVTAGGYIYKGVSAIGTTAITTGPCLLRAITINTKGASGSTTTVFDGSSTGTKIATIDNTTQVATLEYDVFVTTALTLTTTGTSVDLTVAYKNA